MLTRRALRFNQQSTRCNNPVTIRRHTFPPGKRSMIHTEISMKRIAGLLVVVLGVAGVLWADSALSINGAGATFPYPMYSKWFDEYHKKNANIAINYQSIGSGGGIKQVTEGTVDFGATDGPMNDDQLKAYQDKHG